MHANFRVSLARMRLLRAASWSTYRFFIPEKHGAILELTAQLNNDLASGGKPNELTNKQLRWYIAKDLAGGRIQLEVPWPPSLSQSANLLWRLWDGIKKRLW